ncbi:caspase-8-like [Haliotis rufescens]|uniref:caspase-8-like n=1 Tax=Haliotis rufescens TaxID=6454 RepID=UPI00201EB06B|nr:caspase-8-like [Haliotis rufescens]XP_046342608.2 caspase-8-like [Haliotis rufescens]
MTTEKRRLPYAKEFVRSLVETTDDEERVAEVEQFLLETMSQTLAEVETRFRTYMQKLHQVTGEQNSQTMRSTITRMEKQINSRFHTKDSFEKRSKVSHIHREALRNCYTLLTSDLELFKSSIIDDLLASDVMSVSDKDSIRGKDSRRGQNEEFFSYIVGRLSFEDFHRLLLPALRKDHRHVAEALISELDRLEEEHEEEQCVACRARRYVQLKRVATPLLQQKIIEIPLFGDLKSSGMSNNTKWTELRKEVSDKDIIAAMAKKYPDLHKEFKQLECDTLNCSCPTRDVQDTGVPETPERVFTAQESVSEYESCLTDSFEIEEIENIMGDLSFQTDKFEEEYKMTAVPRGICVIINNKRFKKGFPTRRGGVDIDEEHLSELFTKLQFTINLQTDLTSVDMMNKLKSYAEQDHSEYDAFVCFILTNGTEYGVAGSDGKLVKVQDLTSMFHASKCPTLAGKPKMFFIQASRGGNFMSELVQDDKSDISTADEADIFIGHSTVQGYNSARNTKYGSYFVSALVRTLDNHGDQQDLLSCLAMVNKDISRIRMGHKWETYKQVPAPQFTLTKKVYLTSDPQWPYPSLASTDTLGEENP